MAPDPSTRAAARTLAAAALERRVSREIIVRYSHGSSPRQRRTARRQASVQRAADMLPPRTKVVRAQRGESVQAAVRRLESAAGVAYAEPNSIQHLQSLPLPTDPYFDKDWGLENTGQAPFGGTPGADISAREAWQTTTGSNGVTVAVVDTGIDAAHPDLDGQLWTNAGETGGGKASNGVDDDHDGLVDDWRGWDFVGHYMTGYAAGNDPRDLEGHGTHVSGTVAAEANNGLGSTGVAWHARLMPLRVCVVGAGCPTSAIIDAFTYAGEHGADVVNASLGGAVFSQAEKDAIDNHPNTLYVVAAGNAGSDNDSGGTPDFFPCGFNSQNLICVAATDQNDQLASFSNWGSTSVDVAAPGVSVYSTFPLTESLFSDDFEGSSPRWDYGEASGGDDPAHWERTTARADSGTHSVTDSAGGDYENNSNATVTLDSPIDLSGHEDCFVWLSFQSDLQPLEDYFHVEGSGDGGATWTDLDGAVSGDTRPGKWSYSTVGDDLTASLGHSVLLRLRLQTDASGRYDGVYVDDVEVRCVIPGQQYAYLSGTSMATPHVTGTAALIKAAYPSRNPVQIKDAILEGADANTSTDGKIVTGSGRLNAAGALDTLDPLAAPQTSIDSGPSGVVADPAPTFEFSATDPGSTFECRLVGADPTWRPCSSGDAPFTGLGSGHYTFEVRATDQYGNTDGTPASRGFTVDVTGPSVSIDAGPSGTTNARNVGFRFSSPASDLRAYQCRLVGSGGWQPCSSPQIYRGLSERRYTFLVHGIDDLGNVGPAAQRGFTVHRYHAEDDGVLTLLLPASRHKLKLKHRKVKLPIACPAAEQDGDCQGRLKLRSLQRLKIRRHGKVHRTKPVLARSSYRVAPGAGEKLRLKLPRKEWKAIGGRKKLRVKLIARVGDGTGFFDKLKRRYKLKNKDRRRLRHHHRHRHGHR